MISFGGPVVFLVDQMREVGMGVRHTSAVRAGREVRQAVRAGRVEWAVLTAVTVVALLAVMGTAGSKALARWLGAE